MPRFAGIDLGTTYSAVAVIDDSGRPIIVHNRNGRNVTPSCVSERDGLMEVGELALKTWGESPTMAAARFKRNMGSDAKFEINGKAYSPTELSAFVLKKLIQDAEAEVGKIEEAVVTIPANFAHEAREATMSAAKAAGINVKFIINEPTAAALYYAFKNGHELSGVYAVYDLGGGTFDVTIIRAEGQNVEVLASNGVSKLGGDDFDSAIISIVQKKYRALTGKDLEASQFTKNESEEEKKTLSTRARAIIKIGNHSIEVTRDEFEESISSLIAQAEMLCESTLDESGIKLTDLKGVFLVGGSTRMPVIRNSAKKVFLREPEATVNVDEVVALGAALYAAFKGDRKLLSPVQAKSIESIRVAEVTSKCFGTISLGRDEHRDNSKLTNNVLIKKGDKIPCTVTESFYTISDGQDAVHCQVTESISVESDPRFVKVIWNGDLKLPPSRPKGQEVRICFSYDENQIMKCSFIDVATGRESKVDLSMTASSNVDAEKINKFTVE